MAEIYTAGPGLSLIDKEADAETLHPHLTTERVIEIRTNYFDTVVRALQAKNPEVVVKICAYTPILDKDGLDQFQGQIFNQDQRILDFELETSKYEPEFYITFFPLTAYAFEVEGYELPDTPMLAWQRKLDLQRDPENGGYQDSVKYNETALNDPEFKKTYDMVLALEEAYRQRFHLSFSKFYPLSDIQVESHEMHLYKSFGQDAPAQQPRPFDYGVEINFLEGRVLLQEAEGRVLLQEAVVKQAETFALAVQDFIENGDALKAQYDAVLQRPGVTLNAEYI